MMWNTIHSVISVEGSSVIQHLSFPRFLGYCRFFCRFPGFGKPGKPDGQTLVFYVTLLSNLIAVY